MSKIKDLVQTSCPETYVISHITDNNAKGSSQVTTSIIYLNCIETLF